MLLYASPPRYKGRSGHRYFEAQWRFLETASKKRLNATFSNGFKHYQHATYIDFSKG
jgi:hypothetical protein